VAEESEGVVWGREEGEGDEVCSAPEETPPPVESPAREGAQEGTSPTGAVISYPIGTPGAETEPAEKLRAQGGILAPSPSGPSPGSHSQSRARTARRTGPLGEATSACLIGADVAGGSSHMVPEQTTAPSAAAPAPAPALPLPYPYLCPCPCPSPAVPSQRTLGPSRTCLGRAETRGATPGGTPKAQAQGQGQGQGRFPGRVGWPSGSTMAVLAAAGTPRGRPVPRDRAPGVSRGYKPAPPTAAPPPSTSHEHQHQHQHQAPGTPGIPIGVPGWPHSRVRTSP